MFKKGKINSKELEYLESLSEAILNQTPKKSRIMLYFWIIAIFSFIFWAHITKVDEIVRSTGKVIPSGENKILQNLEGGILEEIIFKEGDSVKKGDIILKIKNLKSESDFASLKSKYDELYAKAKRLKAQSLEQKLIFSDEFTKKHPLLVQREKSLYLTNNKYLTAQTSTLKKQISQKKDTLKEVKTKIDNLKKSYSLIKEEIKINAPMVKEGIKPKVEFLKLKREANNIKTQLDNTIALIPQINSAIQEIQSKMKELKLTFISKSKKELNSTLGEIERIKNKIEAFRDSVERTFVQTPVDGTIKKLFVNTIGGVIKPGMDLVEIVPNNKNLIVEVKVNPKDIAFIYPSQKALVKFTAYNFSIYGGLKGKVINISPDTITDKKNNTYYIVKIKTEKKSLSYEGKKLKIIPGMIVSADIITGKRTVLDYILKPILNSKEYIFTEK